MQEVIITINPEGKVKVAVNGVKGKACRDLTAVLEKALGQAHTKLTSDYSLPPDKAHLTNKSGG